ncbi:MAG: hypothetical protein BGN85_01450 [Alphaproteobacteria bacterium 64-11]|nr:hypothetical protein [Alphaproteobacteria bacterium]OJU12240.1 MAG: hypothetical protein BGN85_01450 [Alphaproteobacteria bacterium 64-11]
MAILSVMLLAAPAAAQKAADPDAACEATFTALSANARAQGLSSITLDRVAIAAHRSWMAHHPNGDAGVYRTALKVRAAGLRQAMHDGRITLPDTMRTLVNCHARYERPQRVALL